MMTSAPDQLQKTLEDLSCEKLKFRWHLQNDGLASTAALEKPNVTDTVDQMVARCGPEGAVKITLDILRKVNENHLAEHLVDKFRGKYSWKPKLTLHLLQCKQSLNNVYMQDLHT